MKLAVPKRWQKCRSQVCLSSKNSCSGRVLIDLSRYIIPGRERGSRPTRIMSKFMPAKLNTSNGIREEQPRKAQRTRSRVNCLTTPLSRYSPWLVRQPESDHQFSNPLRGPAGYSFYAATSPNFVHYIRRGRAPFAVRLVSFNKTFNSWSPTAPRGATWPRRGQLHAGASKSLPRVGSLLCIRGSRVIAGEPNLLFHATTPRRPDILLSGMGFNYTDGVARCYVAVLHLAYVTVFLCLI